MEQLPNHIYKTSGIYLGFLNNDLLFSRDGDYLGWTEGQFVWDSTGKFRGMIAEIKGNKYILKDRFSMPPLTKPPKAVNTAVNPPTAPANIAPITLPVNLVDAF